MKHTNQVEKLTKTEYSYPARLLIASLPVAAVILPVLWLTGYPAEEWPFVSGVFALSVIGSGTIIGCAAMMSINRVYRYACIVAAKRGVDPNQPGNQTAGDRRLRVISTAITMLLLAASTWGLAFYILTLVMAQLGLSPINQHLPLISLTIVATGATGFSLIIGGLALFFRTADRNPQRISGFFAQFQNWLRVTGHIGQHRQIAGAPTWTGNSL